MTTDLSSQAFGTTDPTVYAVADTTASVFQAITDFGYVPLEYPLRELPAIPEALRGLGATRMIYLVREGDVGFYGCVLLHPDMAPRADREFRLWLANLSRRHREKLAQSQQELQEWVSAGCPTKEG